MYASNDCCKVVTFTRNSFFSSPEMCINARMLLIELDCVSVIGFGYCTLKLNQGCNFSNAKLQAS